jgi:hypothetical protein
MGHNDKTE